MIVVKASLAMLSMLKGDVTSAEAQYASLFCGPGITICADRLLGLLCQTLGNIGQSVNHYEDSLAFCGKGARPELAWIC